MCGGGVLPLAATLGGAPRTVNDFVLIGVPSGPAAGWISQSAERDFPTRRTALPAGSLSGLLNGSVVRVTATNAAAFARNGAATRPAARLVWSVLMDDPGCLRASPDPHHVNRCDRPRTRFHADHCGGRGVPRSSRPQPGRFRCKVSWWRALRAWSTPGRDRPGADMSPRATDWQLHAREPPVPAQCGSSHRQRSLPAALGHATLSDATRLSDQLHSRCVIRGRALPRRGATRQPHPGWPRLRRSQVNATHRTTRRASS